MKKLLIPLFLFFCFSCTDNTTYDWAFTLTQTTSASPSISGYPKTVVSTTFQSCTTKEAEDVVSKLTTKSITTSGGYTVTIDQKCVKCLKSQYVAPPTTTTVTTKL
ncbi:MAG: hypothetical protein PHR83_05720 [Paludibacter sp.]|nr:hypothetical protein [Paludibacter sp.]